MKKIILSMILVLVFIATAVQAKDILISNSDTFDTLVNPEDYEHSLYWQSFSFPSPINITGARFYTFVEGDGDYYIILKQDAPNGTILATTDKWVADGTPRWETVNFTSPYVIDANITYYIGWYSTNLSMFTGINLGVDSDNPYPDGQIWFSDTFDGELVASHGESDIIMNITYEDLPCVPDWVCSGYGACVNGNETCNEATDQNLCGVSYTGNFSEFMPQSCSVPPEEETGYVSQYTTSDIQKEVVDIGSIGLVEILNSITLIITIVLGVYAIRAVDKVLKKRGIK